MTLISNGINKVRAYALPAGIRSDGCTINEPLSVLVSWQSIYEDKLHQIYINGKFSQFTQCLDEREAIVPLCSSWDSVVCIEVFAVKPAEAMNDYSNELDYKGGNRVRVSLVKKATLPLGSVVDIFSNDGSGEIDFQMPVKEGLPCWEVWQDKWGFGFSCFGASEFGYDGAGAIGFARGSFGGGEFGYDAEAVEWVSGELKAGEYRFGIKVIDGQGNIINTSETEPVIILPAAKGTVSLSIGSYDTSNNLLVLLI
jgi:hypothetical protein